MPPGTQEVHKMFEGEADFFLLEPLLRGMFAGTLTRQQSMRLLYKVAGCNGGVT